MSLKHAWRVIGSLIREQKKRITRSTHWRMVERKHLAIHAHCQACGGACRLQVHHIVPFHVNPSMELWPSNLVTLCMGEFECHLRVGHRGNWKNSNPQVLRDCTYWKRPSVKPK